MTEAAVPTRRPGRPKGAKAVRRGAGSAFGHLVAACGLTYDEAAALLGLSVQTVRCYGSGRLASPPEVMDAVARLWEQVSYRINPTVALPPAAAARRQALQDARTRAWRVKDRSPEKGDEDED